MLGPQCQEPQYPCAPSPALHPILTKPTPSGGMALVSLPPKLGFFELFSSFPCAGERVLESCLVPIKTVCSHPRVHSCWAESCNCACLGTGQPGRVPKLRVNQSSEWTLILMASQDAVRLDLEEGSGRNVTVLSVQTHWSWASNPIHRPHPTYPIRLGQPAGGSKSQTVLTVRADGRRHVAHSSSFPLKCTKPFPRSCAALQGLPANLVFYLPLPPLAVL